MLGALPEKKALVYFASGVTQDRRRQRSAIARHHQRRHPQQRRLLPHRRPRPGRLGAPRRCHQGVAGQQRACTAAARPARSSPAFQGSQETLYTLAADTGGKALLDNNDLGLGIVQAQKEISSYYILGYYSANDKLDGRYRRIKLQPTPDLQAKIGKLDYRPRLLRRQGVRQVQLLR